MKAFTEAKPFIKQCKEIVKQCGWTTGYSPQDHDGQGIKSALVALINTVSDRKTLHRKICNTFPNNGTFTFTDGVVDYVLGLLMQPSPGVMPDDLKAAGTSVWLMLHAGYPEQQVSAVFKEQMKHYL